jgi:hypothetical protein
MKKSDKKIENAIRDALTDVCNIALDQINGFKWITHYVNYSNFPDSLFITCVFEDMESLQAEKKSKKDTTLLQLIKEKLASKNITIKNIQSAISFSTEDNIKIH